MLIFRPSLKFKSLFLIGLYLMGNLTSSCQAEAVKLPISPSNGIGDLKTQVCPSTSDNGSVTYRITEGTIRGGNLFHSFERFSLEKNETALFLKTSSNGSTNIIGRVTGGDPSRIDGTIKTEGYPEGVNLFLLNPLGVVFGPNAKLDIKKGSFHVSTADVLGFKSGLNFFVDPKQESNLSVVPIESFGFLEKPGKIQVDSATKKNASLHVDEGRTISIIGGNINIGKRTLTAAGGRINIASVGSHAKVVFHPETRSIGLNPSIQIHNLGKTKLISASLDVSQPQTKIIKLQGSQGEVRIISGNLEIVGGKIASAASTQQDGGSINLTVSNLDMKGGARISTSTAKSGNAGAIKITATDSVVIDGNQKNISLTELSTSTVDQGNAGEIVIDSPLISVKGFSSIKAISSGAGNAGTINLISDRFVLSDGAQVNTESTANPKSGESGTIKIMANDSVFLSNGSSINVQAEDAKAGNINIDVGRLLQLSDKSKITASVAGGRGKGGDINIGQRIKDAKPDSVEFEQPTKFVILSGSSTIEGKADKGKGGRIFINTDHLFRSTDSIISTESTGNIDGTVEVTSPINNIISGTIQLPQSFLTAFDLSGNPCAFLTDRNSSSLIYNEGRSGLPAGPDTLLPATLLELEGATDEHESQSLHFERNIVSSGVVSFRSSGCSPVAWIPLPH